jgi:hypothetical protein
MKRIIIISLIVGMFAFISFQKQTPYCEGWKEGHCEGWRDVRGQLAVCPVTPICPVPEVNKNTYNGGYNAAFKLAQKEAKP